MSSRTTATRSLRPRVGSGRLGRMDRRSFVGLAGASALALVTLSCAPGAEYNERSLARPELLEALGAGGVRAIGARYRATHPTESDAGALRDAILASRPWHARLVGEAQSSIADLVRVDFEQGRTVVVDGWLLSVTEARQCALFSLARA